jgi:hypothetical protein
VHLPVHLLQGQLDTTKLAENLKEQASNPSSLLRNGTLTRHTSAVSVLIQYLVKPDQVITAGINKSGKHEQKRRLMLGTRVRQAFSTSFVFDLLDIDGDGHITQTEYNKGFDILDARTTNGFLTRK